MTRTKSTYLALLAVLFSPLSANADSITVFDQTVLIDDGLISDVDGNQHEPLFAADDFIPLVSATVINVNWRGVYRQGNIAAFDDFTINFYSDAAGPSALLQSFSIGSSAIRLDTGADHPIFGQDIYDYSVTLAGGIDLVTNTTYWISIFNNTPDGDDFDTWVWSARGDNPFLPPTSALSTDLLTWNFTNHDSFYFLLEATSVPEPATLALFGIGLFGMGLARRKKV